TLAMLLLAAPLGAQEPDAPTEAGPPAPASTTAPSSWERPPVPAAPPPSFYLPAPEEEVGEPRIPVGVALVLTGGLLVAGGISAHADVGPSALVISQTCNGFEECTT